MNNLIGRSGSLALYANNEHGVIIDSSIGAVVASGAAPDVYFIQKWEPSTVEESKSETLLAEKALGALEERSLVAAGDRMYTIPKTAQAEAKKALEWRKEEGRGGTPVGLNTARILAKGGQIGIRKVRHIAKYFPRHEVDKKGKGWKPGQENYPSNGRIAWALWGGDAAWSWARSIVERENKKPVAAGGYDISNQPNQTTYAESSEDINPFKYANDLDMNYGPEFLVRVCLDGSGMDRLYMVDIDGSIYVWDDSNWDNMGHVDGDVWSYDRMLDDIYDVQEKTHIIIDPQSALKIAARMAVDPGCKVTMFDLDQDEAALTMSGIQDEDWDFIDQVILAAGTADSTSDADKDGDGILDSDFLSEKAENQPRDARGKFAAAGSRVIVGGDAQRGAGTITKVDSKTGMVSVKLDSGKFIDVDAKYTEGEKGFTGPRAVPKALAPLNMSGIIGEPRTPINMPKAHLKGTLPPLSGKDIDTMLNNWPKYISDMRKSYKPIDAADKAKVKKTWGLKKFAGENSIVAAAEAEKDLTPATSDVTPKYLAIVTEEDPQNVVDLVALVPASATSTEPIAYTRKGDKWERDDQTMADLRSSTKPPVIELDQEAVNDVLVQMSEDDATPTKTVEEFSTIDSIDSILNAFVAAGGLDRNRGNAEQLRRYWTSGKGAAKIRWGTPGDWTRCVRQLSKYMGPRAKGYCQLRHKDATGVYTGSKLNPGKKNSLQSSMFTSLADFEQKVLDQSILSARAGAAKEKFNLTAGAAPEMMSGAKFSIPLLIPEELESGDGRKFKKDSISIRELPLPLLWQIKTGDGHAGSVVVGRIDYIERTKNGLGNAYGVFDIGSYGKEAERLVRNGFLRGVSADLDQFEAKEDKKPKTEGATELEDDGEIGKDKLTVNKARVMAATIVAKPAFQECTISIDESGYQEEEYMPLTDGLYEETIDSTVEPLVASGFLDSEIPVVPPQGWFEDPKLTKPTPLTVDANGHVYGHIAAWHVNHIGMPRSTRPPRSRSKYSYFHTGVVKTDTGADVPVGQLTLAGGHADLQANASQAAKHYDDTASAIADVHMGEDEYGIWCSGSLRPEATESQIRALRASAPSGDWRPINGSLELVAVCQVNVPGFPIARALVASGKVMALVAAGASFFAIMKSEHVEHFVTRAELLSQLAASTPDLKARVKKAKKEAKTYAITAAANKVESMRERALIASAVAELSKINNAQRKFLVNTGRALPDGSYPIRGKQDLNNAIIAYKRANPEDRKEVRAHIRKRAEELSQTDLIPKSWKATAATDTASSIDKMRSLIAAARSRVTEFAEGDEISDYELEKLKDLKTEADKQTEEEIQKAEDVKAGKSTVTDKFDEDGRTKFTPKTQPRDAKGKYRKVLARLKQNLGVAGLQDALLKVQEAENLEFAGNYTKSAAASSDLIGLIDRLDTNALNPEALENVRATAAELGKTIANLPLPFGKDASKLRFSDLPSGLKDLIEQMITRVEAKIGKEDSDIATKGLKSYMSGADVYSQGEVQSEMSKLLRLLT
jgi:hypothetical protein